MNKQKAYCLLDETFNSDFDILRLSVFLKELLNTSNLSAEDKTALISNEFKDHVLNVTKIGTYKVTDKAMELLAVKLANHSSLERARTMQRNFIANWLANNSDEPEAAIVAFYDDTKDWRFSFVKLEYKLVQDEKGNLKAKKEMTPARRYSYLVGVNEPNHTCKKQFIDFMLDEEHNPSLEQIEKSFGIERVTKEFFEKYKDLFLRLKDSLLKVVKNDHNVMTKFEKIVGQDKEDIDKFCVEFSKRLLGQIVFLYFLQKKGWLGIKKANSGEI